MFRAASLTLTVSMLLLAVTLTIAIYGGRVSTEVLNAEELDDRDVQKMSFTPPQLSEDEQFSSFLPNDMQCDGCKAVASQLHHSFEKAHKNREDSFRLSAADALAAVESTCVPQVFETYGISEVGGRHVIKGPGLYEGPGVSHMGGKTPGRLSDLCHKYANVDEEVIYNKWLENGKKSAGLEMFLCSNSEPLSDPDGTRVELDVCLSKDAAKEEL